MAERFGAPKASSASNKVRGGGGSHKRGSRGGSRGGKKTGGQGSSRKKQLTAAEYELLTNPADITHPVDRLVHRALKGAFEIHPENGMALIFDTVNPVRQYNRDQPYRAGDQYPFATYNPSPEEDPNVTENDSETEPLNPYEPIVTQ
jgi:hypothetical protein